MAKRRAILMALMIGGGASAAAAEGITLELNRLEPAGDDCRLYMVVANGEPAALVALQADLVTFAADGIINGRLAVELAPLDAAKTTVKLFDLPQLGCASIARILLNEMTRCETSDGPLADCTRRTTPSSRVAGVAFVK
jgi:hypothetical protein